MIRTKNPMPRSHRLGAVATALILVASAALAAPHTLTLDPERSEVHFDLEATGHDVHGTLYLTVGELSFDDATGVASGRIELDATRAETGSEKRDRTMHEKVLESGRYPLFVFTAESVEGAVVDGQESVITLAGTIELHGQPHPLAIPARVTTEGDALQVDASFPVPYVEWGLHNPSILFLRVADEVEVSLAAEGRLDAPEASR